MVYGRATGRACSRLRTSSAFANTRDLLEGTVQKANSARDHLDDAALVTHPVPRMGLRGGEETQLLDVEDAILAQLVHVSGRDAVQVDAQLAGTLITDAGHAARVQPGRPEFLHQRHHIDRGRSLELL